MIAPQEVNLTIYQGATYRKSWDLQSNDTPMDLTGWTARMQIREKLKSDVILHELTTENDGIVIDVAAEYTRLSLYINPADTASFPVKKGVYDLELIDINGDVARLLMGKVVIDQEVTR